MPASFAAVLDRVQQVGFARALVAQDRHDLGMIGRLVAVQIDYAEELLALQGKQFGNVESGADLVIGIAREEIAEGIARAAKHFKRPFLERTIQKRGHANLLVLA